MSAVAVILSTFNATIIEERLAGYYEPEPDTQPALRRIRDWNAQCDAADDGIDMFRNRNGDVCFFRCPACGERFVDPSEGHNHVRDDHPLP